MLLMFFFSSVISCHRPRLTGDAARGGAALPNLISGNPARRRKLRHFWIESK
jgi:hypothetical protein